MPDSPRRRQPTSGELPGADREIEDHHRSWLVKHRSAVTSVAVVVVLVAAVVAAFLITRNLGNVDVADPATTAATTTSAAPSSTSPAPSTSAASSAPAAQTVKITDGTVVTVVASGRWTLSAEKNLILTIVTNSATKFPKDKGPDDVKKGTVLTVTGTQSGLTITATSIDIGKKKT